MTLSCEKYKVEPLKEYEQIFYEISKPQITHDISVYYTSDVALCQFTYYLTRSDQRDISSLPFIVFNNDEKMLYIQSDNPKHVGTHNFLLYVSNGHTNFSSVRISLTITQAKISID